MTGVDVDGPTISIIVPAFNADRYLTKTIQSALDQTEPDWELLVVDDGSSDATAAVAGSIAQRDGRVRVTVQDNAGMAAARNRGYALIAPASRYVLFLDADDVLHRDALRLLREALEAFPGCVAAHGQATSIDETGALIPLRSYEQFGRQVVRANTIDQARDDQATTLATLAYTNPITTSGQVLIRRTILDHEPGPFDPQVEVNRASAADWDLWLRLSLRGPFAYVPAPVIDWRRHTSNNSGRLGAMRQSELRVRHKLLRQTRASRPAHRLALWGLWHYELRRAWQRLRQAYSFGRGFHIRAMLVDTARAAHSLFSCVRGALVR